MSARSSTFPRLFLVACAAAAALAGGGCAAKRDAPQPVSGQVFVDGQPAARAVVTFHPVDEKNPARPSGHVDEQGRFRLTTNREGDGAPAGDYRVTVVWFVAPPPAAGRGDESVARNAIPARYGNPSNSDLRATVAAGGNEIPAFKLSRR